MPPQARRPSPEQEARLFGRLVTTGVLDASDVASLFERARRAADEGEPTSLSSLAIRSGLIEKDRLLHLFGTDGDDVPPVPGYRYVAKIGEGGTAGVYRVRDQSGGDLALKILHRRLSEDKRSVAAFVAEARLLMRLEHDNVVRGHKVGRLGDRHLFFMEYVEGRTLQEAIAEGGAFDEDGALYVILQVARALEYLRGEGVVHRDIKPANILVTPDNVVKVIDLGFALPSGEGDGGGTTSGTAAFLSPEQARGQADLDVRSDIYSLGATLYQMVLGELPFSGDDTELVQKAVLEGLSAEATKGGRISAHMHYFIEKMMAKEREIRYQDPRELMADIERQIAGKKRLADPADEDGDGQDEQLRRRLARMKRRRQRRR